ncbi:MAG: glycosyltransferase family 2 protein [Burkholderiales bacterium]|nr:glycosyltransferase family 2 protein [Burkholderiales bacterium]
MPVFSVLSPVYNVAAYVRRCYDSLTAQTFGDWEWVVVDDGSTDGSADTVRALRDARIRLVSYQPNRGRGYARCQSLAAATGEWMVVWDADDFYFPDRLENMNRARLDGYDFFCSYSVVVDNDLRIKGVRGFHPARHGLPRHFVHHTLGCRIDIARAIGYDPSLRTGEDATITWAIGAAHRGLFFDDALAVYREDREVNVEKGLATNAAQIVQIADVRRRRLLRLPLLDHLGLALRLRVKRLVLQLMKRAPALYGLTVPLRSYGQTAAGYTLPRWRVDCLESMRIADTVRSAAGSP